MADGNGAFNKALGEVLSRMRDTSMRDGTQSRDANEWRLADLLPVAKELNQLDAVAFQETGKHLAPVEAFGGGSVLQPAQFSGEEPFDKLRTLHEAAPNLELQSLYRGRQAYGRLPISDEIQNLAVRESAANGLKVIRIFDMMNDIDNMKAGINAALDYNREPGKKDALIIEGAICYMGPSMDGKRAWTFDEYADMAVKLAQRGVHEIAIKDFAGQLGNPEEAKELFITLKRALKDAGFADMPVNLHSHGQKPEVLQAAMQAGADKVDVAIGELAKGSSHTNMRDMVKVLMQEKGFDIDAAQYRDNKVLAQLGKVENTIDEIAKIHKPYRVPLTVVSQQEIADSKLAGGAVSAMWKLIRDRFKTDFAPAWNKYDFEKNDPANPKNPVWNEKHAPTAEEFFKTSLKHLYEDWEKGGIFNTVTPGATIAYDMTNMRVRDAIAGRQTPIGAIPPTYKDILKGRWGHNHGLEDKAIGDTKLRDAFLMEEAIAVMRKRENAVPAEAQVEFAKRAGLESLLADRSENKTATADVAFAANTNPLAPEEVTHFLGNLRNADIAKFREAIASTPGLDAVRIDMQYAAEVRKYDKPTKGMKEGLAEVAELEKEGLKFSTAPGANGGLSERDRAAMNIILLETAERKYSVAKNVYRFAQGKKTDNFSDIRPERDADLQPLLKYHDRRSEATGEQPSVRSELNAIVKLRTDILRFEDSGDRKDGMMAGMAKNRLPDVREKLREKLQAIGYESGHPLPTHNLERAQRLLEAQADAEARKKLDLKKQLS